MAVTSHGVARSSRFTSGNDATAMTGADRGTKQYFRVVTLTRYPVPWAITQSVPGSGAENNPVTVPGAPTELGRAKPTHESMPSGSTSKFSPPGPLRPSGRSSAAAAAGGSS
jgi:hypothetical protein